MIVGKKYENDEVLHHRFSTLEKIHLSFIRRFQLRVYWRFFISVIFLAIVCEMTS